MGVVRVGGLVEIEGAACICSPMRLHVRLHVVVANAATRGHLCNFPFIMISISISELLDRLKK